MPGQCAAHQGHRCIASKDKDLIGNVHAIAFSCGNPTLQNKLQHALRQRLEAVVYVPGIPDPEHQRLNAFCSVELQRQTAPTWRKQRNSS